MWFIDCIELVLLGNTTKAFLISRYQGHVHQYVRKIFFIHLKYLYYVKGLNVVLVVFV